MTPQRRRRWASVTRHAGAGQNINDMTRRPKPKPPAFTLYDALLFTGKSDLSPYGIKPNRTVYMGELWPGSLDRSSPNEAAIRACAGGVLAEGVTAAVPVQLDIEQWPTDIRANTTAAADASIAKLLQSLAWFNDAAPGLDVGFYSLVPIRDYWAPGGGNATVIAAWHAANDYLAPLASAADALYPSLYTFYNEPAGWTIYANANIAEAKRVSGGKRVLPFIWPVYHEASQPIALRGTYIDYDYWKLQLTTIKAAGAEGAVLWGGWQVPWDETLPWWRATKDFLAGV